MNKPYKITYFSFDETFDINYKKPNLDIVKEILDIKTKTNDFSIEELRDQLETNYELLYKSEIGLEKYLFIFIGETDSSIEKILGTVESTKKYPSARFPTSYNHKL